MKQFFLFLLSISVSNVFSQIQTENITSQKLGDTRKVTVVLPENYNKKEQYPLLLVLDANRLLEPTVSSVRYFSRLGEVPPFIVVGVYNTADDVTIPVETGVPFNDTANFFEFIGQELLPRMQSKYSLNAFQTIIGEGESGNFLNYYLLKEKSLFNAYISLSPSLVEKISEPLTEQLATFKTPIFYYLAWAENDDNAKVRTIKGLDKLLKGKELASSYYFSNTFSGVSPSAVPPSGIPEALNLFFEQYRPISMREYAEKVLRVESNTTQYLEDKYKTIKDLYGIDKAPLLEDVKAIYAAIVKKADFESLPILAKYIKPYYKDTALPDYLEGDYYLRTQDPKKAFRSLQRAYGSKEIDFVTKELISQTLEKLQREAHGKLKGKKGEFQAPTSTPSEGENVQDTSNESK